jgi:hypothetical protein
MAATFVVEDGTGLSNANALITVAEANQIIENFGDSIDWSDSEDAEKENAIRESTRYLNFNYIWDGTKTYSTQSCQWPRFEVYDEDYNAIDSDVIPDRIKEACAYLALKVIEGETLLPDFENESKIKKTKDVIGPITEEREYVVGENPDKTYQIADRLVEPFVINGNTFYSTDLERS